MTTDSDATLLTLRDEVRRFVDERDWQSFHSPKNLSMSLMVEVAELMEHFQWLTQDESRTIDAEKKTAVGEEMSDVFCYLMAMANELEIDLAASFTRKMELNRKKYPVEQYRGRYGDDDQRPVKHLDSV